MALKIKIQEGRPTHFIVRLDGLLDSHTFGQLDRTVKMLFENRVSSVQLNLEDLSYISSMGLRSMMMTAKLAAAKGAAFAVTGPQPQVQKVLEIGKVLPEQSIFASVAEADRYFDHIQKVELEKQAAKSSGTQL